MKKLNVVKVTYVVRESRQATVVIDESIEDDQIYEAVRLCIDDIRFKCLDDHATDGYIKEDDIDIDDFDDVNTCDVGNKYFLLKAKDGKYLGERVEVKNE